MEKQYLFAIILLVILLAVIGVFSGKFLDILQNPFQDNLDWGTECTSWAMNGCDMDRVPQKLLVAVNKGDKDACANLVCGDGNDANCKCGIARTDGTNLFCCASKNGGEVYETADKCGTCAEANTNANQVWYRCCQVLIESNLKSGCRCSN